MSKRKFKIINKVNNKNTPQQLEMKEKKSSKSLISPNQEKLTYFAKDNF